MRHCCVYGCRSNSTYNVSFFKLPSQGLSDEWRKVINKPPEWNPKPHTTICSLHFKSDDIVGRSLRKEATPIPAEPRPAFTVELGEFIILTNQYCTCYPLSYSRTDPPKKIQTENA